MVIITNGHSENPEYKLYYKKSKQREVTSTNLIKAMS